MQLILYAALLAPGAARATDLPAAIRHAYQAGSSRVVLRSDPARIPLEGTDWAGHYVSPYVRLMINGKGPYTFLFDTGASYMFVSSKVVASAGARIISNLPGHHEIVRFRSLQAGDVRMLDATAVVENGNDIDGILGFNAFGDTYLTFDFVNRRLIVGTKPNTLGFRAFWLRYVLNHRVPTVGLRLASRTLATLLDTGDDAYAWEATTENLKGVLFDHAPTVSAEVVNGVTGRTRTSITTVDGVLRLGPLQAQNPAVAVNDALPLPDVGMDVLKSFTIEFDRRHRRVGFDPHFSGSSFRVPGEITVGFYITYDHAGRRVSDVLPGLEPARAGMKKGDTILAINGKPAAAVSYRQWDTAVRARRPIRIVWRHAGTKSDREFDVVELK